MTSIRVEFVIKLQLMLLILATTFIFSSGKSQLSEKRGYFGAKASLGFVDSSIYQNYGITGEYILKSKIGLIYNFEYQHRSDKFNHIHASVGTLAGPPLILIGLLSSIAEPSIDGTSSGSVFGLGYLGTLIGLLITILPDGVTYHIPYRYNWDIAPYANVLGIDYIWNKNNGFSKWNYSCSFGVKTTYWSQSNWMLQGFMETRKTVGTGWGLGLGVGTSYSFGSNKKEND